MQCGKKKTQGKELQVESVDTFSKWNLNVIVVCWMFGTPIRNINWNIIPPQRGGLTWLRWPSPTSKGGTRGRLCRYVQVLTPGHYWLGSLV